MDGNNQKLLQGLTSLFIAYHQFYHQSLQQPVPDYRQALQYLTSQIMSRNSYCWLAIANDLDLPAGFIQVYPIYNPLTHTKRWVIYDLFVAEFARKQGLGSQLLTKVAQEAAKNPSIISLQLTTANDNITAQRRYREKGYLIDGYNHYYSITLREQSSVIQAEISMVKSITKVNISQYSALLKKLFPAVRPMLLAEQLQKQQSYLFIAERHKKPLGLALVTLSYCSIEMQAIWVIDKFWLAHKQDAYTVAALLNAIMTGAKLNKIATLTITTDPTEKAVEQGIEQLGFTTDSHWQQYYLPLKSDHSHQLSDLNAGTIKLGL